MANRKQDVLVEVIDGGVGRTIHVWVDDLKRSVSEIESIEGVAHAAVRSIGFISVDVDPRYDVNEVAEEITKLFSPKATETYPAKFLE